MALLGLFRTGRHQPEHDMKQNTKPSALKPKPAAEAADGKATEKPAPAAKAEDGKSKEMTLREAARLTGVPQKHRSSPAT